MRFNWFAHAAACALVVASVHGSADAKPKRPTASAAAKKKATAAAAARKEADRLAAEAAAKAAAVAAEKARLRAQWGVLADIGEGDFQTESSAPVTVRKAGDAVELTLWTPLARQMVRFERAATLGALTMSVPGQWSRKTYEARVLADGSIEATTKSDTRWTALSRDIAGKLDMAMIPGGKLSVVALVPGSKAETKLATLIASGKVAALGTSGGTLQVLVPSKLAGPIDHASLPSAGGIPSMAALQATEGFDLFRRLEGDWWNGSVKWSIAPVAGAVVIEGSTVGAAPTQRKLELKGGKLLLDRSEAVPLSGGAYFPKRGYAVVKKNDESFVVTAGKMKGGNFLASRDQNLGYLGEYRRMTSQMAEAFQQQIRTYEVAQAEAAAARAREKASSGNSGWLGGLIMGGVAAAAGGDAGMVMGAAMKGVEMTTDNQMSRAVLAGQGDAMIQSSIDTKQQIAETERLRVAAAEETRRKREAEAAGKTYTPVLPVRTASTGKALPSSALSTNSSSDNGGGNSGEAFVACNLYGQYEGRKWEFYVSRVGKVTTGYGAAWPDSSDDPISKVWGNYLKSRGADVDGLARTMYPDYPVCHGAKTAAEAEQSRATWLRDVRNGSGNYTVHEESWAPSGSN